MNERPAIVRFSVLQGLHGDLSAVGANVGSRHRSTLAEQLGSGAGEILVFDFSGVRSATASYLKATALWFLKAGRHHVDGAPEPRSEIQPINVFTIVANLNDEIREELGEVLASQRLACAEALEYDETTVRRAHIHGPLDETLVATLMSLAKLEAATAPALAEANPDVKINVTGWNNRLSELTRLRLAKRKKDGRFWVYQPIAREVFRG
jgi:hypothetical protein